MTDASARPSVEKADAGEESAFGRILGWDGLLLVSVMLLLLGRFAFRLPLATAFGVVLFYNSLLALALVSPRLVPGHGSWRTMRDLRQAWFTESFGGSMALLTLWIYLMISGWRVFAHEPGAFGSSLVAMILHFFLGTAAVAVATTYGLFKLVAVGLDEPRPLQARAALVIDQAAGFAILMLVLFGFQIIPIIMLFVLPIGGASLLALAAIIWGRRRLDPISPREWARRWSRTTVNASFLSLVMMLFGFSPFRTHFVNDDAYDVHIPIALIAIVMLVLPQLPILFWRARVHDRWTKRLAARSASFAKFLVAVLAAFGFHMFVVPILVESQVDWKEVHDTLLPMPESMRRTR